ncbi:MAG TPA: HisA/HisF-related TIM barrel protein [Ktedonobacterales bacterium]
MPLTIYPALDALRGRCVRPAERAADPPELTEDDPVVIAGRWREAGASWLHLVDLDGALRGGPQDLDLLQRIVAATGLTVQFAGGVRTAADMGAALGAGAARVILSGEVAARGDTLKECLARWGERVAVSVDTRDGRLTVAGWLPSISESALDFARRVADAGARTLILANVRGDGESDSLRFEALAQARSALPGIALIAAGSFSSLDDLRRLAQVGMDGVVLGRPLYDGALDLAEALRVAEESVGVAADDASPDAPTV